MWHLHFRTHKTPIKLTQKAILAFCVKLKQKDDFWAASFGHLCDNSMQKWPDDVQNLTWPIVLYHKRGDLMFKSSYLSVFCGDSNFRSCIDFCHKRTYMWWKVTVLYYLGAQWESWSLFLMPNNREKSYWDQVMVDA